MTKTNKKTTFLMTSIMLTALLVMTSMSNAYAGLEGENGEIPPNCTDSAVSTEFGITIKVTEAGQLATPTEAGFGNPDEAGNCAFVTTNVNLSYGNDNENVNLPACEGIFLLPGESFDCLATGIPSYVTNLAHINGDVWTAQFTVDREALTPFVVTPDTSSASGNTVLVTFDATLNKSVDDDKVRPGDSVTYTYEIDNTGSAAMDCTLVDDQIVGPLFDGNIAGGVGVDIEQVVQIDGDVTNIATLTCLDQLEDEIVRVDEVTVTVFDPSIEVIKTCEPEIQDAPGTITWTITVTNNGDATLTNVSLVDTDLGLDENLGTMASTEVVVFSFDQSGLEAGVYTNTAAASGLDQEEVPVEDDDDATCEVEQTGEAGCTPGFWKNNADKKDYAAWPAGTFEDVLFSEVFDRVITIDTKGKGNTITDPTLEEALGATGGEINALARHGTAAYLNSVDAEVLYPFSTASVISTVQSEIDAGTFDHSELATANELGCTQNQFGDPQELE